MESALLEFGWWSILPPIIAITLALITKEVISSLIVGILAGALIYSQGNIVAMFTTTVTLMGDKIGGNAFLLIFLGLLGSLVALVTVTGGSKAYGDWAVKRIKSRKGASLATMFLGIVIFIDDYFNCLSVGTVMQPVTDKHKISRAKLAYLLDSTAAPICIIAPISSWGASVASYMQDAGAENGMVAFVSTIPYNLYAIITILMVLFVCLTKFDFGSMAKFEKLAEEGNDIKANASDDVDRNSFHGMRIERTGKVYDLILPILVLIILTILAMIYTGGFFDNTSTGISGIFEAIGNTDASLSLALGGFGAIIFTMILYLPRKLISFANFMKSITVGIQSMVPAFTILILAWSIGGICSPDYLRTGDFIGGLIKESSFPIFILPAIIFVVAGFLGFATGTSWGTMALLIPIGAGICSASHTEGLLIAVFGAILAGAVYGDHISPISDTTILSSTGAGCNHIDHVSSQIPYATIVAGSCLVGYVVMGLVNNPIIPLIVSIIVLAGCIYFISAKNKTPISFK